MKTPEEIMLQVATYGLAANGVGGNQWTLADGEQGGTSWAEGHWRPLVASQLKALDVAGYVIVKKERLANLEERANGKYAGC